MKKGELIVSILDNKMSKHYTQGGEETKGCENPESVYIYLMQWFESPRHSLPYTAMFYLTEESTRWGHANPNCKITIFRSCKCTIDYERALSNEDRTSGEMHHMHSKKFSKKHPACGKCCPVHVQHEDK